MSSESTLGNSVWILLDPVVQQTFVRELAELSLVERIRKLAGIDGYGWARLFLRHNNRDVDAESPIGQYYWQSGKFHFKWITFPHPASWGRPDNILPVYLTMDYDSLLHNYTPKELYVGFKDERGWYYTQVPFQVILAYSDLVLPKATKEPMDTCELKRRATVMIEAFNDFTNALDTTTDVNNKSRFNAVVKRTGQLKTELLRFFKPENGVKEKPTGAQKRSK